MATCTEFYYAEDQNGNDLPFTTYFSLYYWNGSLWDYVDTYDIPSGSLQSFPLTPGDSYKGEAESYAGYTTPDPIELIACTKDFNFVYVKESSATDYYVKTNGDDSKDGESWTNAWKTINKAAITVTDGVTVHIGFGVYDAEPAGNKIAPQNVGTSGISYLPETAGTGGGTGTVSIEQNA